MVALLAFTVFTSEEKVMIQNKEGNLLEEPVDVFVHQANLYHTFGGGIARAIGAKFPEAEEADRATPFGDESKLGTFSIATVQRIFGEQLIVNMYSQVGMTETKYEPMRKALQGIHSMMVQANLGTIGFPYGMGCGIANGNWEDVERIIQDVFGDSVIVAIIVKLPLAGLAEEVRR